MDYFQRASKNPLTTPPKTKIQKQGLIPYQLGYCKEMLLYAIVWKWNFMLSPFHFYFL